MPANLLNMARDMHSRIPIVSGNWKMNTSREEAKNLSSAIARLSSETNLTGEIVLFAPYVWLSEVSEIAASQGIIVGAQDSYPQPNGAYTGAVSTQMLSEVCSMVLVGHSERRTVFGDTPTKFSAQIADALTKEMLVTYCIGENESEAAGGETNRVLGRQIAEVFNGADGESLRNSIKDDPGRFILAYEPVWAIGTGRVASVDEISERTEFIRGELGKYSDRADEIRLQYGGSVSLENVAGISEIPNLDGALVGGASLNAGDFINICRAFTV